ncbi:hypothetical protein B0H10DRAFT_2131435 [Mycena sp. CBHHK59/15]|nr:hypothetical protein B0H10DRAFT_2131435 [Mycena sp. CBHHK59/15]
MSKTRQPRELTRRMLTVCFRAQIGLMLWIHPSFSIGMSGNGRTQEACDLLIADKFPRGLSQRRRVGHQLAKHLQLTTTAPHASANLQHSRWKANNSVHIVNAPLSNNGNLSWKNAPTSWQNASTSWQNTSTSTFRIHKSLPSTSLDIENQPLPSEVGNAGEGTRAVLCTRCRQYVNHGFVTGSPPMIRHMQGSKCLPAEDTTPILSRRRRRCRFYSIVQKEYMGFPLVLHLVFCLRASSKNYRGVVESAWSRPAALPY